MERKMKSGFSITSNYASIADEKVFKKLLPVLMAYAYTLIGTKTTRLRKNRDELAYDLAMEAIKRYLEDPAGFDPSRNPDLVNYLKFNILRRLVSNHKTSKAQTKEIVYEVKDSTDIEVTNSFTENYNIHDAIDLNATIGMINKLIKEDSKLLEVFRMRYQEEYQRAEIIEELNITGKEYNNRIRRLETVLKNVIKTQERN